MIHYRNVLGQNTTKVFLFRITKSYFHENIPAISLERNLMNNASSFFFFFFQVTRLNLRLNQWSSHPKCYILLFLPVPIHSL